MSSTCAYQGYAGGFGVEKVIDIARDSLERVWPDLTIILDVDLKTAAQRLKRELDRMERKGDNYHSRVREGFLKLAEIGRISSSWTLPPTWRRAQRGRQRSYEKLFYVA